MPLDFARVFLFTPAQPPRALCQGRRHAGPDALILDLEDAVSGAGKDEARANLVAYFSGDWRTGLARGQLCGLRVNNSTRPPA